MIKNYNHFQAFFNILFSSFLSQLSFYLFLNILPFVFFLLSSFSKFLLCILSLTTTLFSSLISSSTIATTSREVVSSSSNNTQWSMTMNGSFPNTKETKCTEQKLVNKGNKVSKNESKSEKVS